MHDRDTLNDILAHPEAYQTNVEFQLAADSPQDDLYPELAPSPDSIHPALYAPLSRTVPLPALDHQGPGVAPAQSGPAASSSGNADAAQTTGAPLSFPSLETSSTHSESSALLHYSPAAEAETRRYDEGSARRELAAMLSDSPRRVADPEVEAEQQQQSVSPDAATAAHGEAHNRSSLPQDGASPDDADQSGDGADEVPTRSGQYTGEMPHDWTHIFCHDLVTGGPFIGRKLLISVGKKSQLPNPSEPFDQGIATLLRICSARCHDLTQLELVIHQAVVSDGQQDTRDALDTILSNLGTHLRVFLSFSVTFMAADDSRHGGESSREARFWIARSFSRLVHVQIAGETTAARLNMFPLRNLHILEVLISITETDVRGLMKACGSKLTSMTVQSVDRANKNCFGYRSTRPADAQTDTPLTFPSVIHMSSPFSCKKLIADIPPELVDLHFTLTDARSLDNDVRDIFRAKGEGWTL